MDTGRRRTGHRVNSAAMHPATAAYRNSSTDFSQELSYFRTTPGLAR